MNKKAPRGRLEGLLNSREATARAISRCWSGDDRTRIAQFLSGKHSIFRGHQILLKATCSSAYRAKTIMLVVP